MVYLYSKRGKRILHVVVEEFAKAYEMTRQNAWYWIKLRGMPALRVAPRLYLIPWLQARDWAYKKFRKWPQLELAQKAR